MDEIVARQIDRSWLQHQPEKDRIPSSVWRSLRAFKGDLVQTAAVLEGLLKKQQISSLLEPLCRRRGMVRHGLLASMRRRLPGANIRIAHTHRSIVEISWLSPRLGLFAAPQNPNEQQPCTLVCYTAVWPPTRDTLRMHSGWAAEIPDHALARLLQRAPDADIRAALFAAANAFVAADADIVAKLINRPVGIYLPAGPGCFVGGVVGARTPDGSRTFVYARCQTWLHSDMLGDDQLPLARAPTAEASVAWGLWKWGQL
jgi:hypothetical protein